MHLERLIRLPPLLRVLLIALLAGALALTGVLAAWLLRDEPAPIDPEEEEAAEVAAVWSARPDPWRPCLPGAVQASRSTDGGVSHAAGCAK